MQTALLVQTFTSQLTLPIPLLQNPILFLVSTEPVKVTKRHPEKSIQ